MAYLCELGKGHQVYLDNRDGQTLVTVCTISLGQQQQSSSSLTTGIWTDPPQAFRMGTGAVFKIQSGQGAWFITIQGNRIGMQQEPLAWGSMQGMQMQSTVAMPTTVQPSMPRMTMGNMEMSMNPMEMRMGSMNMSMGSASSESSQSPDEQRFCRQCGAKVSSLDRFCFRCGQALS